MVRLGVAVIVAFTLMLAGCSAPSVFSGRPSQSTPTSNRPASPPPPTPGSAATFSGLYASESSGVVRIDATTCSGGGIGTGFLVAPNLVATVAHVVDGATAIDVTAGGVATSAQVAGIDDTRDLALVRTSQVMSGHLFTLAAALPTVGTPVGAIGFPEGGPLSFSQGTVSGLHRTIQLEGGKTLTDLIQTDTPLNPGNSGGPLLTLDGQVAGLVDAGDSGAEGLNYAVPGAVADAVLQGWSQDPAPPQAPSCATSSGPASAGPIQGSPSGSDVQGIIATLSTYFDAIDAQDYETAYAQLTPSNQAQVGGETALAAADATSYVFNITLQGVTQEYPGRDVAAVSFTSVQDAAHGPGGDTCDIWTLDYTMVQGSNTWLIQKAIAQNGIAFASCG